MHTNEKRQMFDVIVVGGGASGMMAAGVAAARGKSVILLEKNAVLGKKLDITGGGRCNITNVGASTTREFLARFGDGGKYFFSPFSQFSVNDTVAFFESHGLPIKVEAGGRAFPASEKATDVTALLTTYMNEGGVVVKTNTPVTTLTSDGARITEVVTRDAVYQAGSVIIATGGLSHPETGSTGDGFRWLEHLGHTIITPNPSLVPLRAPEKWVHALSGVTLETMKITFFADTARAFAKTGKILFTHFGISGPLVLNSAKDVGELIKAGKKVTATIDLFPADDFAALDTLVLSIIDANKNRFFKNVIGEIVPPGMSDAVQKLFNHPQIANLKTHSLTQEDRKRFVHLLKALPLTIEGLMGLDRAIVSDGGIDLHEVDTRTMRSQKIENLFVTGDLLNINRPSGGYSLQLCWTTGFVAGTHA